MPDEKVCFDTSVLRYFSQGESIELLRERYQGRAFSSEEARTELEWQQAHGVQGLDEALHALADWITCFGIEDPDEVSLFYELKEYFSRDPRKGRGEAAAIVIARRLQACAVLDERAARNHARRLGLRVIGTIGILHEMVRDSQITWAHAEEVFQRMLASGFRAPAASLLDSLKRLGAV